MKRLWGKYKVVDIGTGYQVKKLVINPGKAISLQMHHHRSEHWVVIRGVATVTRAKETFELKVNEATCIPSGMIHKLENRTESVLKIIEIQLGEYLGEDDIIRFNEDA
ncbi:MAG: phosphomannose isomerase type II C-terminal cupin domain [Gammaproteobacteria bacterium]|nr:phosphomannose isomerase type II C-terminal cupin domain [Gammaproteobacteria bacterium]